MRRRKTLEKDLRQTIVDAAKLLGWRVYFTWHSIHSPAGYPDLCLVKDKRLIFAELKNETNKLSDAQVDWLDSLRAVPFVEVYVVRPDDLDGFLDRLAA